jgi:hypothetical protein
MRIVNDRLQVDADRSIDTAAAARHRPTAFPQARPPGPATSCQMIDVPPHTKGRRGCQTLHHAAEGGGARRELRDAGTPPRAERRHGGNGTSPR